MDIELTVVFANGTRKNEFSKEIVKWEVRCEIESSDDLDVHYSFKDYTNPMRACLFRTLDALIEDGIVREYNHRERDGDSSDSKMIPSFAWKSERGSLVTAKHVLGTQCEFICIVELKLDFLQEFCVCRYWSGDPTWFSGRYHGDLASALKQYNATSAVNVTLAEC